MEFGKTDFILIVSMSIAIISISFVAPALGITDQSDEVGSSDIPEFNMSTDRFDFAGDFPRNPGAPAIGTLTFDNNRSDEFSDDRIDYHHGDAQDGVRSNLNGVVNDQNVTVAMQDMVGGGINFTVQKTLTDVGQTVEISNETTGYTIEYTLEERTDYNTSDVTFTVDYIITDRPEDTSFLSSVPLVGTLFSAGEALANIVGWIGSVLFWFFGTLFQVTLNLVGILLDIVVYGFDMSYWLINTYTSIVTAASSWAAVFVLIPSIILFLEFAKLGMIAISLLPTT